MSSDSYRHVTLFDPVLQPGLLGTWAHVGIVGWLSEYHRALEPPGLAVVTKFRVSLTLSLSARVGRFLGMATMWLFMLSPQSHYHILSIHSRNKRALPKSSRMTLFWPWQYSKIRTRDKTSLCSPSSSQLFQPCLMPLLLSDQSINCKTQMSYRVFVTFHLLSNSKVVARGFSLGCVLFRRARLAGSL